MKDVENVSSETAKLKAEETLANVKVSALQRFAVGNRMIRALAADKTKICFFEFFV